jgi:hypothetical protein
MRLSLAIATAKGVLRMFIGHFAPALIAAAHPKAPRLGTLFVAAQLVDIAFFGFAIVGIENMRITPGLTAMNAMDLYDMPYTHSLGGGIIFASLMAWVIYYLSRNAAAALIAAGVVLSHWFIDLLAHAPDLTLFGSPPKLGLGLWNYPLLEMPLELGITGAALGFYISRTRPSEGNDTRELQSAYWLGGVMLALQLYNWLGPQPKQFDLSLPIMALVVFGFFIWLAYRLDRTRKVAA